ncbi:MAG: hypothetical protein ACLTSX_03125 [Collinsella sp.]
MAKKRNGRQDAIREIVRTADVRTQRMLVDELKACGFDCTQATVSRDIADMGPAMLPGGHVMSWRRTLAFAAHGLRAGDWRKSALRIS